MDRYIFNPANKIANYTQLICGIIMLIAGGTTLLKVAKGSKNNFCYVMQAFTIANGLTNISWFFSKTFRKPVELSNNKLYSFKNEYWTATTGFIFYSLSLQSWFFAMQYY